MRWSVLRDMIAAYLRYPANKVPIHYILCNDLNYLSLIHEWILKIRTFSFAVFLMLGDTPLAK